MLRNCVIVLQRWLGTRRSGAWFKRASENNLFLGGSVMDFATLEIQVVTNLGARRFLGSFHQRTGLCARCPANYANAQRNWRQSGTRRLHCGGHVQGHHGHQRVQVKPCFTLLVS